MATATTEPIRARAAVTRAAMPTRMRALFVTTPARTGAWLAEALAADSASEVQLAESIGVAAGLARLRDELFDLVLVSHEPGDLDALALVEGLRGGGNDEPVLVLGAECEQQMAALCYEVGADAYLCVTTTTTRTLLWAAARAIERHELLRENRRLLQADRHRLHQEHLEADRLLAEQRALIGELASLENTSKPGGTAKQGGTDKRQTPAQADMPDRHASTTRGKTKCPLVRGEASGGETGSAIERVVECDPAIDAAPVEFDLVRLPENLVAHYRELLRAYVIMGTGNLTSDMRELALLLVGTGITPQQTMLLHLQVLEELVRGLGNRSARHVMTRADLLALELMIHVADGYRGRFVEQVRPPRQMWLPGIAGSRVAGANEGN